MAPDRSVELHMKWYEASSRFDYFILGVALALVGYLGQALELEPLGLGSGTIELAAILSLLASAYSGFRRIEATVTAMGVNTRYLHVGEQAGKLRSHATSGGWGVNVQSGEILSAPSAAVRAAEVEARKPAIRKGLDDAAAAAERWYRWRNRSLILGFLLLIAARVSAAYGL